MLSIVRRMAWDALDFTVMLHKLGMNPTAIASVQVLVWDRAREISASLQG